MKTPDLMPILSAGSHGSPAEGACIMEYASLLAGEDWTDSPKCTHPVLAAAAREVNDLLGDEARQTLLPLLPRLMGTTSNDLKVSLRLAVFAAQSVLHLVPMKYLGVYKSAVNAAMDVADNKGTEMDLRKAYSNASGLLSVVAIDLGRTSAPAVAAQTIVYTCEVAFGVYYASNAPSYFRNSKEWATTARKYAVNVAGTVAQVVADDDLVAYLTALIDEYDRLTKRGQVDALTESDLRILQGVTG